MYKGLSSLLFQTVAITRTCRRMSSLQFIDAVVAREAPQALGNVIAGALRIDNCTLIMGV
jgi:hypothetical protein